MVAMEMMVQEPQPRTLNLAKITLTFEIDYSAAKAEALTAQYLGLISEELSMVENTYRFSIGGQEIEIDDLYIEFESVEWGSIKVNFALVCTFLTVMYNGIADYPDFKVGFSDLSSDIQAVISASLKRLPRDKPIPSMPDAIDITRREEDDLLAEISGNF